MQFKRIDYKYDLISGNVHEVNYQKDSVDKFFHKYEYDGDNRITDVLTSPNGVNWDHDAFYQYYRHGPLARTILGEQQVQGLDYAYTLQGWIRGLNSSWVCDTVDMGRDGSPGATNEWIARDAFGFTLGYFYGDYRPIGATPFEASIAGTGLSSYGPGLYNGNIRYSIYSLPGLSCTPDILYTYRYDQLNRLTAMWPFDSFDSGSFSWDSDNDGFGNDNYAESVSYDPNGNILTYNRKGSATCATDADMDDLEYNYYSGTNKLEYVADNIPDNNYSEDIDDQAILGSSNYIYDLIGNLIVDVVSLDSIWWNNYGKIDSIRINKLEPSSNDTLRVLKFRYDPNGNRIEKRLYVYYSGEEEPDYANTTYYVRDARGNILTTYRNVDWNSDDTLSLLEHHIYGSSRLGLWNADTILYTDSSGAFAYNDTLFFTLDGRKQYELTNHLGNVYTTISDKHVPDDGDVDDDIPEFYAAEILSQQDYYPGGMLMPGRTFNPIEYRFGFNGEEKTDEVNGSGNIYDYGFRIYNPRIGRFLSVDPLSKNFPWNSPFAFAENDVIANIDLDGLEKFDMTIQIDEDGNQTAIVVLTSLDTELGLQVKIHGQAPISNFKFKEIQDILGSATVGRSPETGEPALFINGLERSHVNAHNSSRPVDTHPTYSAKISGPFKTELPVSYRDVPQPISYSDHKLNENPAVPVTRNTYVVPPSSTPTSASFVYNSQGPEINTFIVTNASTNQELFRGLGTTLPQGVNIPNMPSDGSPIQVTVLSDGGSTSDKFSYTININTTRSTTDQ